MTLCAIYTVTLGHCTDNCTTLYNTARHRVPDAQGKSASISRAFVQAHQIVPSRTTRDSLSTPLPCQMHRLNTATFELLSVSDAQCLAYNCIAMLRQSEIHLRS